MNKADCSREASFERRRKARGRKKAMAFAVILAGALVTGGTLAFLSAQSDAGKNTFLPGEVSCVVEETFAEGDNVKTDVHVHNTGNINAYVRVEIVAAWVEAVPGENGTRDVLGSTPVEGEHYSIELGARWIEAADGFYYYTSPVAPNAPTCNIAGCDHADHGATANLIDSCTVHVAAPVDGYVLQVDVIASAIQADGADDKGNRAVELAWGVDIEGGAVKAATIER